MAFSYLTTVLATSPIAHYPLNEPSGTTATDATGNGHNATYGGTVTLNQAGLVADGPCVLMGASGIVTLPNIDISNRSFAVAGFVKYASLVDVRYFFQAFNASSAGKNYHSYVTSGGVIAMNYFFDDFNTVTQKIFAATIHHVLFRYNAGTDTSTIWVDGVLAATGTGKGPLTAVPSLMRFGLDQANGSSWSTTRAQHLTLWRDTIPADADIPILYAARANAGDQPPVPGAFTVPATGGTYDASIAMAWPVAAGATSYDLDYSANAGGSWTNIVSTNAPNSYTWNTSGLAAGAYLVRVRATNAYGSSAYQTSGSFNILHPPAQPGVFTSPASGAYVTDGSAELDCGDSTAATSYDFDYSDDAGGSWHSITTGVGVSAYTWDVSGMPDGAYLVRCRGVNGAGNSTYRNSSSFNIQNATPGLTLAHDGWLMDDPHQWAVEGVPETPDPANWSVGGGTWDLSHGPDGQIQMATPTSALFGYDGDVVSQKLLTCIAHAPREIVAGVIDPYLSPAGGVVQQIYLFWDAAHNYGIMMLTVYSFTQLYVHDNGVVTGPISGALFDAGGNNIGTSNRILPYPNGKPIAFEVNAEDGTVQVATDNQRLNMNVPSLAGKTGRLAYRLDSVDSLIWMQRSTVLYDKLEVSITGLPVGFIARLRTTTTEGSSPVLSETVEHSATADVDGVATIRPMPQFVNVLFDGNPSSINTVGGSAERTWDTLEICLPDGTPIASYDDPKIGDVFTWAHAPIPSYKPDAITVPAEGDILQASAIPAWSVPAHAEGDALESYGEYSTDGGQTWSLLFDWTSSFDFHTWNTSGIGFTREGFIRIKARSATSLAESDYTVSGQFTVYHPSGPLPAPITDSVIGAVTDRSVYFQVADSEVDGHDQTRVQVYAEDGVTALIDVTFDGADRFAAWLTGLEDRTLYELRYALIDVLGTQGTWSNRTDFVTLNMADYGPHVAVDEMAIADGSHTEVGRPFIDHEVSGFGEFPVALPFVPDGADNVGARLNSGGESLSQTPADTSHVIRFKAATPVFTGGGHLHGYTAMLLMVPLDLTRKAEIMGQPSKHFAWHEAGGKLNYTMVPQTETESAYGNVTHPFGQDGAPNYLTEREINALFIGGNSPYFDTELAVPGAGSTGGPGYVIFKPRPPEEEIILTRSWSGINGGWYSRIVEEAYVYAGSPPNRRIVGMMPFYENHQSIFDLGHGSSNAQSDDDFWANGNFSRIIAVRFAYWDQLLNATQVRELAALREDADGLDAYIAGMDPQPICYSKINEYPRPDKPTVAEA